MSTWLVIITNTNHHSSIWLSITYMHFQLIHLTKFPCSEFTHLIWFNWGLKVVWINFINIKPCLLLLIPNYKTWYTFSMALLSSAYMTWRHVSKHEPHTHHQISHVCTKWIQNFEIDNIYTWWFGKVSNRRSLSCNV